MNNLENEDLTLRLEECTSLLNIIGIYLDSNQHDDYSSNAVFGVKRILDGIIEITSSEE